MLFRSLQLNRGDEAAAAYIRSLPERSATTEVLLAEIQLRTGRANEGIVTLRRYAREATVAGARAADLLARTELEAQAYNDALRTILANESFALSVPGHELAARVYLTAGEPERAAEVLRRIAPHSAFAQEFLSAKAFKDGDYKTAREALAELVRRFPERADLRESLRQAEEAEAGVKGG